ncbi:formate dehydrogenase subunit delta [Mesorhizobium sp. IMUNJ 23232]|uniref:formate dehydrogenase subunit delta n=1 Tax=Mesorhizobium sp. IMUNJ 23232 TaxID=3376064 RepID=UPI0037B7CF8C
MSHDETHAATGIEKIVRMANQIGTFFESKEDRVEGVHGVAEHINKFWEPRMRRHFFEVVDSGGEGLKPIVIEAAAQIRRPTQHVTAEQAAEAAATESG